MQDARLDILRRYGAAVVITAAMLLVRSLLHPFLGERAPLLVMVMAFIVSAWYGGVGPGLLATGLSATLGVLLFVAPTFSFKADPSDLIRVAIFVTEGVATSWLIGSRRSAMVAERAATARLRESEERARLLIDSATDHAIFLLDPDGRVSSWNAGARRMLGYAESEVLGQPVDRFATPEERASGVAARSLAAAQDAGRFSGEGWRARKDGSRFYAATTLTPLRGPRGETKGFVIVTQDVTRRHEAEQATRDREARYRGIFESVVDGIITIDSRGKMESVNAATRKIFGYDDAEMLGQNVRMLMPEPYYGEHDGYIDRYQKTGERRIIGIGREVRGRRKDGSVFPMDLSVGEVDTEAGKIYVGVIRDITARKQAEDERTRLFEEADVERRRLHAVMEALPIGVVIADGAGRATMMTPEVSAIWGEPPDVRGTQDYDIFEGYRVDTGERLGAHDWALAKAIRQGATQRYELVRIRRFDGGEAYILNNAAPIRDADGQIIGGVAAFQDVTALRHAEDATRDLARRLQQRVQEAELERRRLQAVLDAMPIGVVMLDANGALIAMTGGFREIWGGDPPSVASASEHGLYEGYRLDSGERLRSEDWASVRALHHGEISRNELVRIRRFDGGEAIILNNAAPIRDAGGNIAGCVVAIQDVTPLRRAEEELRAFADRLEQRVQERTADLEAFSYTVSHDLRAPLRSMRGFAEALVEDYGDKLDDVARGYTARIAAAATKMDRLITDLLAYSRLAREHVDVARVDLNQAVAEARGRIEGDLRDGGEIAVAPALPLVRGHYTSLVLAIQNLLDNALKFVPADRAPRVRVEWEALPGQPSRGRLHVIDNGPGVPPEHQERIFRVFERLHTDEQVAGTGIGLAIVRRTMQRMGGEAGVRANAGPGADFWLELPMAEETHV